MVELRGYMFILTPSSMILLFDHVQLLGCRIIGMDNNGHLTRIRILLGKYNKRNKVRGARVSAEN